MKPKIQEYDLGIKKISINLHHDDRGFLGEIFRQDWNDIIPDFIPKQFLISQSKPGIIRAWHRHLKNQIDILFVRKGKLKICAYDGDKNSKSYGKLDNITINIFYILNIISIHLIGYILEKFKYYE